MTMKTEEQLPLELPNNKVNVYGERVQDAKTLRKVTSKAIAEVLGKTPSAITHLEKSDTTELPLTEVRLMADYLQVDEKYLTTQPISFVKNSDLHFRASANITKKEISSQLAFTKIINEFIIEMVKSKRVELFPVQLEGIDPSTPIDEIVSRTRKILRIDPTNPIPNLINTLEQNGVIVIPEVDPSTPHIHNHDAYSSWTVGDQIDIPLIIIKNRTSWERQRLSVAHELGHLIMHRYQAGPKKEEEAFNFAIQFLLPLTKLYEEWPQHATPLSLLPMKRKWGISIAALARYGHDQGLINRDRYTSIFRQLSNNKDTATGKSWRVQEPGSTERPIEKPRVLAAIVSAVYGLQPDPKTIEENTVLPWDYIRSVLSMMDSPWAPLMNETQHANRPIDDSNVIRADFGAGRR
ncbi:ImmA/IrrE family metallo-endopeptidase [Rothia terrae]|uniref:ImmA/IrrE family metallo-endopeptidase n=1 Tax=Rothia terrae TaxID=396015 RepID=UPI003802ED0D